MQKNRVHVIGGGLAGLTAAIFAARNGADVELFEGLSRLGGRARTRDERGFRFNMGPHALYSRAAASEVLRELGVTLPGGVPPLSGSLARLGGRLHALPGGFASLLATGLLRLPEKLEIGRFLAALPRRELGRDTGRSLNEVLERELRHARSRQLIAATVRLSTYCHAPDLLCAGAALGQLELARGGVRYLDGGWQTLVDALARVAEREGVRIQNGLRVERVECEDAVTGLRLTGGRRLPATRVVLALGPVEASDLVESRPLARCADAAVRVRAASLDVGLSRLPVPRNRFALGIDEPTYFSVHSGSAELAPPGGALIHVARYLAPGEKPERSALRAQLEGLLDQMQPGWREALVTSKLLTDLTVTNAAVTAEGGGLSGRPGPESAGVAGLWLAGDWVGPTGQLADASLASGREAGCLAAGTVRTVASEGRTVARECDSVSACAEP